MKTAAILALLFTASFLLGRRRASKMVAGGAATLDSLPAYHGWYAAMWCGLPVLAIAVVWMLSASWVVDGLVMEGLRDGAGGRTEAEVASLFRDVKSLASGDIAVPSDDPFVLAGVHRYLDLHSKGASAATVLAATLALAGGVWAFSRIRPDLRARAKVEKAVRGALLSCSTVAILVTIGIVFSLILESARFFEVVSPREFLFGLHWSPQTALRADQVGSSGSFGAVPVFAGTLVITLIAMGVAVPVGLMSAVYMTFYARPGARAVIKPLLEVLAGIPTVVYGFFAALSVAPLVRDLGMSLGLDVASESALAAGLVMGVMIIPFVSSLSDDAITAVPGSLRDGSFALGSTRSETIRKVILPAALPGIMGAFLLAVSRAVGETMIVVMAAGLAANLTANPLEAVTTVTVQIVTLLTGDQEFDSAKTLSAFALGLVLFAVTLCLNLVALRFVRKYREQYD